MMNEQNYHTSYESPNIVIVPTVSFLNEPPVKKLKLDDVAKTNATTNTVNKTLKCNSWASNYLQSIGQSQLNSSPKPKKPIVCIPDRGEKFEEINQEKNKTYNLQTKNTTLSELKICTEHNNFSLELKKTEENKHINATNKIQSVLPLNSPLPEILSIPNIYTKIGKTISNQLENKQDPSLNLKPYRKNVNSSSINSVPTQNYYNTEKRHSTLNEDNTKPCTRNVSEKIPKDTNEINNRVKSLLSSILPIQKNAEEEKKTVIQLNSLKNESKERDIKMKKTVKCSKVISHSQMTKSGASSTKYIKNKGKVECNVARPNKNERNSVKQTHQGSHKPTVTKSTKEIKQSEIQHDKTKLKYNSEHKVKKQVPKFKAQNKHERTQSSSKTGRLASSSATKEVLKPARGDHDKTGKNLTKKAIVRSVVRLTKNFKVPINKYYKESPVVEDLRQRLNRAKKYRDNLIVSVPNVTHDLDNKIKQDLSSKSQSSSPKLKTIKIVINLICEKPKDKKLEEEPEDNESCQVDSLDVSFLDDFNVDDIVASLNFEDDTQADNMVNKKEGELLHLNNIKEENHIIDVGLGLTGNQDCISLKQNENNKNLTNVGIDNNEVKEENNGPQFKIETKTECIQPDEGSFNISNELVPCNTTTNKDFSESIESTLFLNSISDEDCKGESKGDITHHSIVNTNRMESNLGVSANTAIVTNPKHLSRNFNNTINSHNKNIKETLSQSSDNSDYLCIDLTDTEEDSDITIQKLNTYVSDVSSTDISKSSMSNKYPFNNNDDKSNDNLYIDLTESEELNESKHQQPNTKPDNITSLIANLKGSKTCNNMSKDCAYIDLTKPEQINDQNVEQPSKDKIFEVNNVIDLLQPSVSDNMSKTSDSKNSFYLASNGVEIEHKLKIQNLNSNTDKLKTLNQNKIENIDLDDNSNTKQNDNDSKEKMTLNKREPIVWENLPNKDLETSIASDSGKMNEDNNTKSDTVDQCKVTSEEDQYSSHFVKHSPQSSKATTSAKEVSLTVFTGFQKTATEECLSQKLQSRMLDYLNMKYDIGMVIRRGKYSNIFHCKDQNKNEYALKILHRVQDRHSLGTEKENILKNLQKDIPKTNQHFVYLINGFGLEGHWCFLMEYYPKNLRQVLVEKQEGFRIDEVQKLSRQLVSAIIVLRNNNIIHSDVKPEHILINNSLNRIKLCGFDECRKVDQVILLPNIGTPSYRAPEVILGYSDGFSIDVWSTAAVMFEMATSQRLFPGVYNNDILYRQMCILGNIPFDMVQSSIFKDHHFQGTMFTRKVGYMGKGIQYISKFHRVGIASLLYTAYNKFFRDAKTEHIQKDRTKLRSFCNLLHQMLVMDPKLRLRVEFVYADPFIFETFKN